MASTRESQMPLQRLQSSFPFTPKEVRQIRKGMLATLKAEYRQHGKVSPSHHVRNMEIIARALRALESGIPNSVVHEATLNDLFVAAWASFRSSRYCGKDDTAAHRAATLVVQMHLEFHLGILEHVTIGEYRDDA